MFQVIDGDYNVYSMDMFEEGDEVRLMSDYSKNDVTF